MQLKSLVSPRESSFAGADLGSRGRVQGVHKPHPPGVLYSTMKNLRQYQRRPTFCISQDSLLFSLGFSGRRFSGRKRDMAEVPFPYA